MKQQRDLDLIRKLLLDLEGVDEVDLSEYEKAQIHYHNYLIINAGLAEGTYDIASSFGSTGELFAFPALLTWEGQEFLANARNESAWNSVKAKVQQQAVTVSFSVVQALLAAYMKDVVGL